MGKYKSNAEWPPGVCSSMYGDNISTDEHDTFEAAQAVCDGLKKEGFGGQREYFPIRTWVSTGDTNA
jgi:hypothetical protein